MSDRFVVREPQVRQRTVAKARVLLEALPYMKEHRGTTVVVKLGGAAMDDPRLAASFAEDVALVRLAGIHPVVVHGGGPQITAVAERLGATPRFVDGLRVTDAETLDIAKMVLVGKVNKEIVSQINRQGIGAVGLSGDDANLLLAAPKRLPSGIDLGFVGDVVDVGTDVLRTLMTDYVPVVASIATDGRGRSYNVNADEAAAAIAVALRADKLVYLTDVPGLFEDVDGVASLLSEVTIEECERLLRSGDVTGGMIPKVEGLVRAMEGGVGRAHVLDGRVEHALILELFTPEGLGTMVAPALASPVPEVAP